MTKQPQDCDVYTVGFILCYTENIKRDSWRHLGPFIYESRSARSIHSQPREQFTWNRSYAFNTFVRHEGYAKQVPLVYVMSGRKTKDYKKVS